MGIGYVASSHNFYEGRLKLSGAEDKGISPGTLVSADFAQGTFSLGITENKPVYFLAQEIDEPIEYGINDVDQVIKNGTYGKLAPLAEGMQYKTTEVTGSPVAGDVCNFADGKFTKSSAGTAGADFVVTQVDTIASVPIYTLAYNKVIKAGA